MKKQIAIIGAGISGLTLAYQLKRRYANELDITVFEKSSRIGGWIETKQIDRFLFELGPRSCRTAGNGKFTLQLIEELQLQDQVLFPHPNAKKRYLFVNQQLVELPYSVCSLLRSSLFKPLLKALFKDLIAPRKLDDESVEQFCRRRFGRACTDLLIDCLINGIYAGDPKDLSIQACLPFLKELEIQHRSVLWGMLKQTKSKMPESTFIQTAKRHSLFSFQRGMQTLVDALGTQLKGEVQLNQEVEQIHFTSSKAQVLLSQGDVRQFDRVYCALPSHTVQRLITGFDFPSSKCSSVYVVNIGYRKQILKHEGFGCLVPSNQGKKVLGIVFDSSVFPQQDNNYPQTRLTVMLGGTRHPDVIQWDFQAAKQQALESVKCLLGCEELPSEIFCHRALRAIPQYQVGHNEQLQQLNQSFKRKGLPFYWFGASCQGVAVNDCISQAYKVALDFQSP